MDGRPTIGVSRSRPPPDAREPGGPVLADYEVDHQADRQNRGAYLILAGLDTMRPMARAPLSLVRDSRSRPSRLRSTPQTDSSVVADPSRPEARTIERLRVALLAVTPHDGGFELRLPGVYAIRRSRPTTEPVRATYRPALCVVAQGAKLVMLGTEIHEYDEHRMLVFSVDLPLAGLVTRASSTEPLLSCTLLLDPARIADLSLRMQRPGPSDAPASPALYVTPSTNSIVEAVARLIEVLAQPDDADVLGPIIVDEILVRLLRSPVGSRVALIGQPNSGIHHVARAVRWIQEHFAQPLSVEALAHLVHMSVSTFHLRFKAVTSMSPLQYQKVLRLQEARRLMLAQALDAGSAAHQVGYLSPSQFSREYARLFGSAPVKDIARLRKADLRHS
jgi:AraC-like DNA-binding protein